MQQFQAGNIEFPQPRPNRFLTGRLHLCLVTPVVSGQGHLWLVLEFIPQEFALVLYEILKTQPILAMLHAF